VIAMRKKKRLSRSPHPHSVFSPSRHDATSRYDAIPSRRASPPTRSLTKSKHRVRAAHVRVAKHDVIVVEVKASLVTDAFEAQLALTAIELTCGKPAVLWAYEPCGCRDLFGRREHIVAIDAMSSESLAWEHVEIDFARPVIPGQTRCQRN
jgi:hypothetical protein